jgi:hypothetical protein
MGIRKTQSRVFMMEVADQKLGGAASRLALVNVREASA